jgi:hypothetical protein
MKILSFLLWILGYLAVLVFVFILSIRTKDISNEKKD